MLHLEKKFRKGKIFPSLLNLATWNNNLVVSHLDLDVVNFGFSANYR